eukprot:403339935
MDHQSNITTTNQKVCESNVNINPTNEAIFSYDLDSLLDTPSRPNVTMTVAQQIDLWRIYINQQGKFGSTAHFLAIEKLVQAFQDQEQFFSNRFYTEVWIKYAQKVKNPQDVYETMLHLKIGACFNSTYEKIANYFEFEALDYRRADKIYRVGLQELIALGEEKGDQQLQNLQMKYRIFTERMKTRVEAEVGSEIKQIKSSKWTYREKSKAQLIRKNHEKIYANSRRSYTKNQIILGGVPIYVDDEFREEVIPSGTREVEKFYDHLSFLDGIEKKELQPQNDQISGGKLQLLQIFKNHEMKKSDQQQDTTNYFVQQLTKKRIDLERDSQLKHDSYLDRQPFMKLEYKSGINPFLQQHQILEKDIHYDLINNESLIENQSPNFSEIQSQSSSNSQSKQNRKRKSHLTIQRRQESQNQTQSQQIQVIGQTPFKSQFLSPISSVSKQVQNCNNQQMSSHCNFDNYDGEFSGVPSDIFGDCQSQDASNCMRGVTFGNNQQLGFSSSNHNVNSRRVGSKFSMSTIKEVPSLDQSSYYN